MDSLTALVFWIPLAGGLIVWGEIGRRWCRGEAALRGVLTERVRSHAGTALVACVWIAGHLLLRIFSDLGVQGEAGKGETVGLEEVRFSVGMNAVLVTVILLALSEAGRYPLHRYGLHLQRWKEDIGIAALGFLASLPPVALVFWMTHMFRREETLHPFIRLMQQDSTAEVFFWILVAVVVAAPLAEELLYRVVLQGTLRTRLSAAWSVGLSAVVFAGVHGFPDSLALLPLGIILGYVFEKRQSYLAVVLLHALFNLRTFVQMLLDRGG